MAITIFDKPVAKFRRPYGSYRFDVFSLKAGRRMTLFGKAALGQFIELEADHEVSALCERPLKIPNSSPERIVDFWAVRGGRPHFFLLGTGEKKESDKRRAAIESFAAWAKEHGARLHEIDVGAFQERRILHANWSTILQHLVAHRGQVTPVLLERCALEMQPCFTLGQLESQLSDLDAMLARAATFHLLATGRLRCPALASELLYPGTILERR